jgi:hypothetical protein
MRSALLVGVVAAQCTVNQPPEAARVVLTQPMPLLDGAHLNVTLVEVRYAPRAGSAPIAIPAR